MTRRWGKTRTAIAIAFFMLPYAVTVFIDLAWLNRRHYHHLGDYSGVFSVGLNWLEGSPYKDFPWPLWGLGQVSALITLLIGLPTESLYLFNLAWIVLNTTAALLAAYLTACLLEEADLPPWFAVALGFIPFSMPILSTGWIHSNPYFILGALLGPGSAVLVARLTYRRVSPMHPYEWTALVALGYIVANNFATAAVVIAAAVAFMATSAARLDQEYSGTSVTVATSEHAGWLEYAYLLLMALAVTSVVGALAHDWLKSQTPRITAAAALGLVAPMLVALRYLRRRYEVPSPSVLRTAVVFLFGWFLGTNVLVLRYGYSAREAMGTVSAPKEYVLQALVPEIQWPALFQGTYWYWFLLVGYLLALCLIIASLTRSVQPRGYVLGAGLFSVVCFYVMTLVTGWDMKLPFPYVPRTFAVSGRYLWIGIAVVFVAALVVAATFRMRLPRYATALALCAIGGMAIAQSVEAKKVLVERVNETLAYTDAAIDRHLAQSPRHIVLVANAYFPERAMMLYAYYNTRTRMKRFALRELERGRIRHIGRYPMWVSPLIILRQRGLKANDVLIVAEGADYPKYIRIMKAFHDTDTYIARIDETAVEEHENAH